MYATPRCKFALTLLIVAREFVTSLRTARLLYNSAAVIDTAASKTGPSRFHSDRVLSSQILFGEMKEAVNVIVHAMKRELDNTKIIARIFLEKL